MPHVIETTVSVLMEVEFPMSMIVEDNMSPALTRMNYSARLDADHALVRGLLDDRILPEYAQVLRVDVR
jgi:hypothetical protein